MAQQHFPEEGHLGLQAVHIPGHGRVPVDRALVAFLDATEDLLDGLLVGAAVPVDEVVARLRVQLDRRHPGPVLAPVVLLLHKQEQLVDAVEGAAVLLLVVVKGLAQADEGQPTFVFDRVAQAVR